MHLWKLKERWQQVIANKPDKAKIMAGLKDFQRKTVDYIFSRLYTDDNCTDRFLIADEVGLGKTLVARGVIAKAIDHLWDTIDRLDIIYICANADIARQNINRLNITGDREFSFATRMTLLPMQIHDLKKNKMNFISFTPDTSLNLHSKGGKAKERVMLYHLLKEEWNFGDYAGPKNLFQCGVTDMHRWRNRLNNFNMNDVDSELAKAYIKELENHPELREKFAELIEKFSFYRQNSNIPYEDRRDRDHFIGQLREVLAHTCISELEPDLVILDEFQRFKYLLKDQEDMGELARVLFNFPDVKLLLLSATPYKMYTMYHERDEDDHYKDLMSTVDFLFSSKEKTNAFKEELKAYRSSLLNIKQSDSSTIYQSKSKIEESLGHIMVRNERVSITKRHDAMVMENEESPELTAAELKSFAMLDKVSDVLDVRDTVNYWKSAPYLINFMQRNYKLKSKLIDKIEGEDIETKNKLKEIFSKNDGSLLLWEDIYDYKEIFTCNAKLALLMEQTINSGAWRLLWVPASMPYYKVDKGPYAEPELQVFTKSLIFSSWRVVPRTISMLVSYEAERRMVREYSKKENYQDMWKNRVQLLRFALKEEEPARMSNFNILYPCFTLSDIVDPAEFIINKEEQHDLNKIYTIIAAKIKGLLEPVVDEYSTEKGRDEKWYWAALALLDKKYNLNFINKWFNTNKNMYDWETMINTNDSTAEDSPYHKHIKLFKNVFEGKIQLGNPPEDLVQVLTKLTLGSPAVIALRSLRRIINKEEEASVADMLLGSAARIALNFRTLFNLPDSSYLIRGLSSTDDSRYWESILDYNINGNLQAVLDEYLHVLKETNGLNDKSSNYLLEKVIAYLEEVLTIVSANPEFDEIITEPELKIQRRSMRCRYALRFGDSKNDQGGKTRAADIRNAFNSPFRPFILASTSIGQEGLDFHLYCHRIYHWNLPSNPVDLEQREGRIHRYKGHAIRRNVAKKYMLNINREVNSKFNSYQDIWDSIFNHAKDSRNPEFNDMIPYWISELDGDQDENGHKIYRHIPALPLSNDVNKLKYLKKTLGAYRMVFGQPRQEDLLKYLSDHIEEDELNLDDLLKYRIDLTP
jgi:hypothetical protein